MPTRLSRDVWGSQGGGGRGGAGGGCGGGRPEPARAEPADSKTPATLTTIGNAPLACVANDFADAAARPIVLRGEREGGYHRMGDQASELIAAGIFCICEV